MYIFFKIIINFIEDESFETEMVKASLPPPRYQDDYNLEREMKSQGMKIPPPVMTEAPTLESFLNNVRDTMKKTGLTGLLELRREFVVYGSNKVEPEKDIFGSNRRANSRNHHSRSSKSKRSFYYNL